MSEHPETSESQRRLGLDGLRGLAVLAVIGYHAEVPGFGGGFLGLSLFFTLSGFLITSLLIREHSESGSIAIGPFWIRRVRRIAPTLFATVAGVILFGMLAADAGQLATLRTAVPAALASVTNWLLIIDGGSYADLFAAASPLQHLWSLAIEVQFYLVAPIFVLAVLGRSDGTPKMLAWVSLALAVLSATWMAINATGSALGRSYYGSDTRAAELLLGCAAAGLLAQGRRAADLLETRAVQLAAVAGLGLWVVAVATVDLNSGWLWSGGLAVLAALASLTVAAAVIPGGLTERMLSVRPLVVAGRLSYALYLVHWPIFVWLDGERTSMDGAALVVVRLLVTTVVAIGIHVLIEEPVRLRQAFDRPRSWVALPASICALLIAGALITSEDREPEITFAASTNRSPSGDGVEVLGTSTDRTRILVAGDSLAANLASALIEWGDRSGAAEVTNMAVPGCGVARGGEVQSGGVLRASTPVCEDWTTRWSENVDLFEPDVVVVHSATWDLLPRRIDQWEDFREIGNKVFDLWLLAEYEQAIETLSADGAAVVWLTPPCVDIDDPSLAPAGDSIETLARLITERLATDGRSGVSELDLATRVCPDGDFIDEVEGVSDGRPDGVHFSDRAAAALAEWIGPELVASSTD